MTITCEAWPMQKKLVHKIWPIRSNALSRSPFIPNKLKNKVNFLRVEYTVMISEQMVKQMVKQHKDHL